ncbi:MAG: hypothetical protein J6T96_05455 [Bacteroidales bacterium]|nr:hypothetical protein [Bacteroidales bacterium]
MTRKSLSIITLLVSIIFGVISFKIFDEAVLTSLIVTIGVVLCVVFIMMKPTKIEEEKNNQKLIGEYSWFLRWVSPMELDYDLLIDPDKYRHDLEEWCKYNDKRKSLINELVLCGEENNINYFEESYKYYTNHDVDCEVKKLLDSYKDIGVDLLYRPNTDYLIFDGPKWRNEPDKYDCHNEIDKIFVFDKHTINNVTMDCYNYFNEKGKFEMISRILK